MMRGIFLGMALLAASASMARAQTLLETVLYVVTMLEPADNPYHRITVEQDENSIHSEFVGKTNTLQYSASVQRIADCEFAVDMRSASSVSSIAWTSPEPIWKTLIPSRRPTRSDAPGMELSFPARDIAK